MSLALQSSIDPTFKCTQSKDAKGNIVFFFGFNLSNRYVVYPKQMDRFETKPYSRKFPIVLYDLREVDNIRVELCICIHQRRTMRS